MKKSLVTIVCLLLLVGCHPTVYSKTVTVHMNARGEVQSIDVVEKMTQTLTTPVRTKVDPTYKYLGK